MHFTYADMPSLAFTTRIPLAVMILVGIKQWENRSAIPSPASGQCAMTCSKSSDEREYANFLAWARQCFPAEAFNAIPAWDRVSCWRGNVVALCAYSVGYTPGPRVWNEGYPVWWHLTDVRMLDAPIPCRGNMVMWRLPDEITISLRQP